MKAKNYPKIEIVATYSSVNWQELYNFLKDFYNPLSLREFRGYVSNVIIDNYAARHWNADKDRKGFGELLLLNAEKDWSDFKIEFFDSADRDRFLNLEIDCINKRIIFVCSLDNREKLIYTWDKIKGIFNSFKILKQKGSLDKRIIWEFLKKHWRLILIVIVIMMFCKQIDWKKTRNLKYWLNEKHGIPFKNAIEPSKKAIKDKEEITLLYLFEHDFVDILLKSGREEVFSSTKDNSEIKIRSKIYYNFEAQTKFIGFHIPSDPKTFDICVDLVNHYKDILKQNLGLHVETEGPHLQPVQKSELKFSGRVFIYHEYPLFADQKRKLFDLYKDNGLSIQFRDSNYLWEMKKVNKNVPE